MIMKAVLIFSVLCLFLCGCSADDWYGCGYTNRANLSKIEIGMNKTEILVIMGKPDLREASDQQEWWLYETNCSAYAPDSERYTPVVFENGKVIGWGRNFWTLREQKYDIKIEQKIR